MIGNAGELGDCQVPFLTLDCGYADLPLKLHKIPVQRTSDATIQRCQCRVQSFREQILRCLEFGRIQNTVRNTQCTKRITRAFRKIEDIRYQISTKRTETLNRDSGVQGVQIEANVSGTQLAPSARLACRHPQTLNLTLVEG